MVKRIIVVLMFCLSFTVVGFCQPANLDDNNGAYNIRFVYNDIVSSMNSINGVTELRRISSNSKYDIYECDCVDRNTTFKFLCLKSNGLVESVLVCAPNQKELLAQAYILCSLIMRSGKNGPSANNLYLAVKHCIENCVKTEYDSVKMHRTYMMENRIAHGQNEFVIYAWQY